MLCQASIANRPARRTVDGGRGGSVALADRNIFEICLHQTLCSRCWPGWFDFPGCVGSYCLFPSFEDVPALAGANATGHFTGQHGRNAPLSATFVYFECLRLPPCGQVVRRQTNSALLLGVRLEATIQCSRGGGGTNAQLAVAGAMCTALTCQPHVPVLGGEKRKVGRSRSPPQVAWPGERERARERETDTDRHTDTQTDTQIDRHTDT